MVFTKADGSVVTGYGMYAALSHDEGKNWPVRRLLTPGPGEHNGAGWTGAFATDATHAEPKGDFAATRSPDGVIHLLSSGLHDRFNLDWRQAPATI